MAGIDVIRPDGRGVGRCQAAPPRFISAVDGLRRGVGGKPISRRSPGGALAKPAATLAPRSQSGLRVHSSETSDFLAPMLRSNRLVVERLAAIPFSSCLVDLNPFAECGSFSIARSLRF